MMGGNGYLQIGSRFAKRISTSRKVNGVHIPQAGGVPELSISRDSIRVIYRSAEKLFGSILLQTAVQAAGCIQFAR